MRPTFIPHWKAIYGFLKDGKTDWKPKALLVIAIIYLLWPIDILPDVFPILGWLDDIGIASAAVAYVSYAANRYLQGKS
jgi:uncharacterized membrane protein YkvA (DUF1232 family)